MSIPSLYHSSSNRYSYILSYIVYVTSLDYRFRGDWSHEWVPRYHILFYSCLQLCSISRRLSHTHPGYRHCSYHLYSSFIVCFIFTSFFFQHIINKVTKVLNCTVTFFRRIVYFRSLRQTIGTWRERNRLYELELTFEQVTCINTSSAFDYHCRLAQRSLPILKLFVSDLGQVSPLEYVLSARKTSCLTLVGSIIELISHLI